MKTVLEQGRSSAFLNMVKASNIHPSAKVRWLHDFQSTKSVERKQIIISAANHFRLSSKSAGDDSIVVGIAANGFPKGNGAHHSQLAFKNGQRSSVVHGRKLFMQPFCNFAIFRQDRLRRYKFDFPCESRANYLQWRPSEEHCAHDDISVENSSHRRDLRVRLALRTSAMAFEMSIGVIPASLACRRASSNASSNSAAISSSVGVFRGCMIMEPL